MTQKGMKLQEVTTTHHRHSGMCRIVTHENHLELKDMTRQSMYGLYRFQYHIFGVQGTSCVIIVTHVLL